MDIGYTDSDFSDTPSRPKVVSPATVLPPVSSSQERSQNAPLAGELERLREILYGGQARVTERRLSDQEKQIETLRRELTDMLNEKVDNFVSTSEVELSSTRSELSERLEQQANQQTGALRTAQHTLSERLDKQELDQVTELRTIQKDVNERLEKLGTDFVTHLRNIQRELSERITQINNEQTERLRQLQNDSRQRNSNLRQELLMLAASLEDNKISRHELGHMLQELGQRLRTDRYGAR
ncbi:MAG: hypothetical protein ACPGWR_11340 [Ardenticatenaceae bacterium]